MTAIKHHGTVEELPNGRHRVRFRVDGPLKTIETFATAEEAEANRSTMAKMLSRERADKVAKKLSDYGVDVIDERELGGELVDIVNERSRWKTHVAGDAIGKLPIGAPDDSDIRDWLLRLKKKGLSRGTRIHCLNLMRAVIADAIDRKLHRGPNPCVGVRLKKEKRTEEPWTYLTVEEQDRLVAATPKPLDAIVEVSIGTGLRSGELVALLLEDVDTESDAPHIMVRYGGPPKDRKQKGVPTKGGKPRRVELFGRGLAAMKRWLAGLPKYCKDNPLGLAFPGHKGGRRSHDHVFTWALWKGSPQTGKPGERNYHAATTGILTRAGIARDVRWHDLRHTCASSLVSGWWGRYWTLAQVCELMGHASITTTERYAHLADTDQKKASRETDAVFHACSTNPKNGGPGLANSSTIPRGAGHGVRTRDLRLGNTKRSEALTNVYLQNGTNRGTELLEAVARQDGEAAHGLAVQLAREVLSSKPVVLAGQVLAGGEHALAAAVELAELVLSAAAGLGDQSARAVPPDPAGLTRVGA